MGVSFEPPCRASMILRRCSLADLSETVDARPSTALCFIVHGSHVPFGWIKRGSMSRLDDPLASHVKARAEKARRLSARALHALTKLGVEARLVGSLARGDFMLHSDVDILVVRCPEKLRYRIEGLVEDRLERLPFDVLYLDEVSPRWRAALAAEAALGS
jgi:predicted nucleotidyltransferase